MGRLAVTQGVGLPRSWTVDIDLLSATGFRLISQPGTTARSHGYCADVCAGSVIDRLVRSCPLM